MPTETFKTCFYLTKDGEEIKIYDNVFNGASPDTEARQKAWDEYGGLFMPREVSTITFNAKVDADAMASILDYRPQIENVIFNPPATIVFWSDNTKTVVKCQDGDEWDAEKGLAMAISKKYFYNKGRYNAEFQKWLSEDEETEVGIDADSLLARYFRLLNL